MTAPSLLVTFVLLFQTETLEARLSPQPEVKIPLRHEVQASPEVEGILDYCPTCREQVKDQERDRADQLAELHFPRIFGENYKNNGSGAVD